MVKQVPNILTFGRVVLTMIFLAILLFYGPACAEAKRPFPSVLDVAFILFVITGLTDIVDGKIARKYNVTSKLGRIMDPLADKVLVCGSFICFAWLGQPTLFGLGETALKIIHWLTAFIIIARELYVTILRHIAEAKGINFAATASGKIKMFLQAFAIGTVIVKMAHVERLWGDWFTAVTLAVMLTVTVFSGIRATSRSAWKKVTS